MSDAWTLDYFLSFISLHNVLGATSGQTPPSRHGALAIHRFAAIRLKWVRCPRSSVDRATAF